MAVRLLREPSVPILMKALPILAGLYVVSPFDFIPDFLPVLGQLDDVGVMLIALQAFIRLCPAGAVEFHRASIAQGRRYYPMPVPMNGEVIDAEFRLEDDKR